MEKKIARNQIKKILSIDAVSGFAIGGAAWLARLMYLYSSEQRATLMSVNSFAFSIIMIILSPIFGLMFS